MTPKENFTSVVPKYMSLFIKDFNASDKDAAAVFGNAGYESNGFTNLQEIKPVVKGSKGGYGWFQWTGPRRREYEAYCKRNNLNPADNDSNYKFLFVELTSTEKHALPKLKAASSLADKVIAFEDAFERAGVKRYPERQKWAKIAYDAYTEANASTPVEVPVKEETPVSEPLWLRILKLITKWLFKK